MPNRPDQIEIFAPASENDQTPGYLREPTGFVEPLTADHRIFEYTPPDPTNPTVRCADVLVVGPTRNYKIGPEDAGKIPKQPRRGEILIVRDDNTQDTRALAYHPSQHPEPPSAIGYDGAEVAIPPEAERRSLRGTAMHERHTLAHWPGRRRATREERLRVLASGGAGTTIGDEWQTELDALQTPPEVVTDPPGKYDDNLPWT